MHKAMGRVFFAVRRTAATCDLLPAAGELRSFHDSKKSAVLMDNAFLLQTLNYKLFS